MRRPAIGFTVVTVLLYAGVIARASIDGELRAPALVGGGLVLVAIVLGALTLLAWRRIRNGPVRAIVSGVLAYHACFGPVFLAYMLTAEVTRNDDLPPRLYPHIVHAINSLE